MPESKEIHVFGSPAPGIEYLERRAAYAVIAEDGRVVMVKAQQKYFLPGGGSSAEESPEETVIREVREELARDLQLGPRIGAAIQYFYSETDDLHYKMRASFFVAEFRSATPDGDVSTRERGEHELHWLPLSNASQACFHACHAWAINQAIGFPDLQD